MIHVTTTRYGLNRNPYDSFHPMIVRQEYGTQKLQDKSEISILSIRQIQELLFVKSTCNIIFPARTDTNLGDLDLSTLSVLVYPHRVYIIKQIVRWLRIAPFVLTCQQHSDGKHQGHTRHTTHANYNPWNMVPRYHISSRGGRGCYPIYRGLYLAFHINGPAALPMHDAESMMAFVVTLFVCPAVV